jgi:two-component system phosphate regulon sensor histidine kinase PhoR
MKSNQIRFAVILGSISIIGIMVFQWYWVSRSYTLVEEQFNRKVEIALYNVAEKMATFNQSELPNENPVRQISSNYFIVDINDVIDAKILDHYLKTEFEYSDIIIDYEYAIYDCETNKMVYGSYIKHNGEGEVSEKTFQKYDEFTYYFGIIFPSKTLFLLNNMNIWLISFFVLVTAIVFFAYAIFIILRQKRLSEIQKDFINNMTHEFKTPISTIGISAGVIADPAILSDPNRLKNYAGIISEQNKRLENQIEKVLQLATIDSNKLVLKKEPLDTHKIILEVVKGFDINLKEKNGVVYCDLKAENQIVQGDRQHFTNVIYNLLDNAVKYSQLNPRIEINTFSKSGKFYLQIIDNGIGIDKKHLKRIFDKFFRVPTGNIHNVKGFGLGLNYVMNIIEAHKWSIKVNSEPGSGSTFTIIIK